MKKLAVYISILFAITACNSEKFELNVSALFSDNMVLQQQSKVAIWGNYGPGKKVSLTASWGIDTTVTAGENGEWKSEIRTPEAGGPYSFEIKTKDSTINIQNILIGEVWLASGQSNMEMTLSGWPPHDTILNSANVIANAENPNIRMFTVAPKFSAKPISKISGTWQNANPENAANFSATAYFFAKKLNAELNLPVGIIHSSWGGTVAEAWTSSEKLKELGDFDQEIEMLSNSEGEAKTNAWFNKFESIDEPTTKEGWEKLTFNDEKYALPDVNDSEWVTIELPGPFDIHNKTDLEGIFWLRKKFEVENPDLEYTVNIGAVDDMDATFINGKFVGGLMGPNLYTAPRNFKIPKGLLKKGTNTIAIRALDNAYGGSISGPINIESSETKIDLAGEWKRFMMAEMYQDKFFIYGIEDEKQRPNILKLNQNVPTVLFNAMINPLIPFTIKGAIWYQGESNVGRADQYAKLFPLMINDWRKRWENEFPFYYVQIAPWLYSGVQYQKSADLRNAQRLSLSTPNTGMIVTLDIGSLKTIHPANKQDVGARLANLALDNNYDKKILANGPLYKKATTEGNKIIVEFNCIGSGLKACEKGMEGFEIAGENGEFYPAKASIENNTVVVSCKKVPNPKVVRYAWSDEAQATLFNNEGLPASTFSSEK